MKRSELRQFLIIYILIPVIYKFILNPLGGIAVAPNIDRGNFGVIELGCCDMINKICQVKRKLIFPFLSLEFQKRIKKTLNNEFQIFAAAKGL